MKIDVKLLVTAGAALIVGCTDGVEPTQFGTPQMVALTNGESAAVLVSLNDGEIQVAGFALPRLVNTEVRAFAQLMIDEHTLLDAELDAVLVQEAIVPLANPVSLAVADDTATMMGVLVATTPGEADAAYITGQLAAHQQALALIDCAIFAGVQSEGLAGFIANTVRPMMQRHYELAADIALRVATATPTVVNSSTASCDVVCDPAVASGVSVEVRDAACP